MHYWQVVVLLKKFLSCFLAVLLVAAVPVSAQEEPQVSGKSVILVEAQSGRVLYAKNEKEKLPMASTTKIMTALLAAEEGELDREILVTKEMLQVEGTSMGLLPGDTVTLEGLIYGMLLQSGNDAANVTALTLAGSKEKFAERMNRKARLLGMENTHFVTPSGLDAEGHYSTAEDMSKLARAALENPVFAQICAKSTAKVEYGNPPYMRTMTNHNKLLKMYDGAIGVKTGFTKKSGRCLVSAAQRGGITLIVVTLNDPNDWDTHQTLFDYGFQLLQYTPLDSGIEGRYLPVVGSVMDKVALKYAQPPAAGLKAEDKARVTMKTYLEPFVYAPLEAGQVVGCTRYYLDGVLICETPIVSAQPAEIDPAGTAPGEEKSFLGKLWEWIKGLFGK